MRSFVFSCLMLVLCAQPATAQEDSLVVNLTHHLSWRGYHFGAGGSADLVLDLGLLGHPRTRRDLVGLRGRLEQLVPLHRRDEREAAEQYAVGALAYACLNGLDCSWRLHVGADELFRPYRIDDPGRSTEISATLVGDKRLEAQEMRLRPSLTVRRDFHAFDGWMAEAGIANMIGGDRRTTVSALWRLSQYRAWGQPPGRFRSHNLDLRVTFRSHHLLSNDALYYSWTLLLEVGGSFAASHIGSDIGWFRAGVSLVR